MSCLALCHAADLTQSPFESEAEMSETRLSLLSEISHCA